MTPLLSMPTVSCSQEELDHVRHLFRQCVDENPDLFDPIDVAKVYADDWTVKRFIGYKKHDLDEASAALIKAMKWRKTWDVVNIKSSDFPAEFFWTGECHEYVRDKNNCSTMYARVKFHKPLTEFQSLSKKFLIYMIEKKEVDIRNGANGWALIYDCSSGTIFNNNMDLLFFIIEAIFQYYPLSLTYVGLYELPWVMRAIYHICRGWIPEEFRSVIHFLNSKTIIDYVGQENLPDYLNGTCALAERTRTPAALPIREFALKHNIPESGVSKFFSHYKKYLDMGDQREQLDREKELAKRNNDTAPAGNNNTTASPIVTSA